MNTRIFNGIYSRKGFTLIELIVAIAVFAILVLGILGLVTSSFTINRKQGGLLVAQDQARKVSATLMNELRNATSSNTGAYPLVDAQSQQLTFYSNIDGGVDVERVRYYIQNGQLQKGVVKPSGSPLTYNFASEASTVVQVDVANGSNPLFYYYDGSFNGVTDNPLSVPVSSLAVKLIKMDLSVYNKAGNAGANFFTITTVGTMRNLKTNLGN